MKKIMFVCLQKEIIEDLQVASLIDMDPNIELYCYNSIKGIEVEAAGIQPDLIVLSYDALKEKEKWDFKGIPIAYHAKNEQELQEGARYGFPTIGQSVSAAIIMEDLKKPVYQPAPKDKSGKEKYVQEKKSSSKKEKEIFKEPVTENVPAIEQENAILEDELDSSEDDIFEEYSISNENENSLKVNERNIKQISSESDDQISEKITSEKGSSTHDVIEEGFQRDTGKTKAETKVITVYSAKGGVGKTTIASELATYLSLVNVGRRKLRVCIVDYNIDFGDVRSTLKLGTDGPSLTEWASEINEYMKKGKKAKDIHYSRDEIEKWLRKDKRSGLYVLTAPVTNEDSMGIETDSLSVVLDNIVDNGEFDYVICDTGNNTRDSTVIALEKATTILLIITQNVNTAICDKAFIETMKSIEFDLSKIKVVINNIMPQKSTRVSVQELVELFPHYDCIGKLKFNTDVIKSGNLGEPLSFHPDHEFSKQLRSIVTFILQENSFDSDSLPEKKKNIFERIFRRH